MMANASTLHGSERRWGPFVMAFCTTSLVVCLALASTSLTRTGATPPACLPAWLAGTLAWVALSVSNLVFLLRNRKPSIGMLPPSATSVGLAAAAALATSPSGWTFLLDAVLAAVGLVVTLLFVAWFARLRGAYAHDVHIPDDATIMVLGGGVSNGEPSRTLACRLDVALDVAVRHPQATFVLTGGPTPDGITNEAEAMREYLCAHGMSRERMLLEPRARNTRENVANSMGIAREHGLDEPSFVVTSDYHVFRALRIATKMGRELGGIPAPTPLSGRLQQWCREVITVLAQGS